jgi:hypothetical protein
MWLVPVGAFSILSMKDVTALVLSLGEDYTSRAIASVRRQTLPVAEIIVVRGISPFHRALNSGAALVKTEFFIQVDADMILDDTCVAELRNCVSDQVGMVLGHLRDPLLGSIEGIKLFRTRCFENVQLRDHVSSETEFNDDIVQQGWMVIHALKYTGAGWHTFGEHSPDYNPYYTFYKFSREGAKARHRKVGLWNMFHRFKNSQHKAVLMAVVAVAHGFFAKVTGDMHGELEDSEEFQFIQRFLTSSHNDDISAIGRKDLLHLDLRNAFKRSLELGTLLRRHHAGATFQKLLRELHQESSIVSWVALVGLCHGLFLDKYREADAEEAFCLLTAILPLVARKFLYETASKLRQSTI